MGTYRVFLVGFLLAGIASAQQPSNASVPGAPTYKFEGRVVRVSGDWIQIYAPEIVDAKDHVLFQACSFNAQSGAFTFRPLPAGTYTVRIGGMREEKGDINQAISIKHKVVVASDQTDVELALNAGISIPVTVRKESQLPVERCWWEPLAEMFHLSDCRGYKAARVALIPLDSTRRPYLSGPGVVPDPTHFAVHGVEPGKYVVRVELPRFPTNYVQSVVSGNLDLLHEPLNVPEDGSVRPIENVVRDDFAFIKVQRNPAVPPPVIVLVRKDVLLSTPEIPPLNDVGFPIAVAPGSYTVFAFDSITNGHYSEPEFLSQYAERAVTITVNEHETKSVNVDV